MVKRPKVSVFIAASLDGFIARKDGKIDWLDKANSTVPAGEDCGYGEFFESVDTLVMGRKTFEKVLTFSDWPYGEKRVVVLSSELKEPPAKLAKTVTVAKDSPTKILERLSRNGSKHVYLDGGLTIQSFLAEGLVDEITVTCIPVLLGEGISLFGKAASDIELAHVKTRAYENGFVQTTYTLQPKPQSDV